jgi:hypothetical protein
MVSIGTGSGLAKTGGAQRLLVNATPGTAAGKLAVDGHRRHRADAERLGTFHYLDVVHVVNFHATRGTGQSLHECDHVFAYWTAGTEDLYFPFGIHFQAPFRRMTSGDPQHGRHVTKQA